MEVTREYILSLRDFNSYMKKWMGLHPMATAEGVEDAKDRLVGIYMKMFADKEETMFWKEPQ